MRANAIAISGCVTARRGWARPFRRAIMPTGIKYRAYWKHQSQTKPLLKEVSKGTVVFYTSPVVSSPGRLEHDISKTRIQGLEIIARDAGTPPNWQGADGFYADDVVAEICALLVNVKDEVVVDTVINHLGEQMSDMIQTGGLCPSGRLRVFQCYMILRDYFDGTHLPTGN